MESNSNDAEVITEHVDVLIVGGGPVGLLTAHQLRLSLPLTSTIKIIDQHAPPTQSLYGRAITLFPRSAELLDQLGLADRLAQQCFACRQSVNYDGSGNEAPDRGWSFADDMRDSKWGFAMVLRQRYQEDVFRAALRERGVVVGVEWKCVGVSVLEVAEAGGHRVEVRIEHQATKDVRVVKCKYLVGADGGKSFVRRAVGVAFDGSSTETTWVRIDGVVDTDIPKPRGYCGIESPTHGNVLWQAMDRGSTRIGFALKPDRAALYSDFDQDAAVAEAVEAVKPFKLAFRKVEWWTKYVVAQRIARSFSVKDCVFLVGDACHTHSSGAAQGLNVGIHDSVNLCWKLSLVMQGKAQPKLLQSYEIERRPIVEKLLKYNKDISRLMTGQLPESWTGDPEADTHVVLAGVMREAGTFNTGLGIDYLSSDVLICDLWKTAISTVKPGQRAPDVVLQKPATFEETRLQVQTPNVASFYIVVFAGDIAQTRAALRMFTESVRGHTWLIAEDNPLDWISLFVSEGESSAFELLGETPLGRVFFDGDGSAHARYGIDIDGGAVMVIRADGWVGTVIGLNDSAGEVLKHYFGQFLSGVN